MAQEAAVAAYWHSEVAYARFVRAELRGAPLEVIARATRDVRLFSSLYLEVTCEGHPSAEPPLGARPLAGAARA